MDGNGRWATERGLPRTEGHRRGVESVRAAVQFCLANSIKLLTLFAFGSDNWRRPKTEVRFLWQIFSQVLNHETTQLHKNGVRIQVVGDLQPLSTPLKTQIQAAMQLTQPNTQLLLNIAVNYGGQWDIVQAAQTLAKQVAAGVLKPEDITESVFQSHLSLQNCPDPDLFIRTSGEMRLSNFLLWQLKYTELYFTPLYWPDFRQEAFQEAIHAFYHRERRFGMTGAQLHVH
jgi:undecaprenyl diphosphate synthase